MPASASSLDIWQMKQNQIGYLAGGFYVLQSKYWCKTYYEPLKHALYPAFLEYFCNFV